MDSGSETTIKTAVIRELGEGATSLANDVQRYFKSVLRDIAAFHQWSWLETTPVTLSTDSGQSYISIPDYLGGEISIHQVDSGREIRYIDAQEYARLLAISDSTTDKPDWWTVRAGRIEFYMPLTTGSSVVVFGTIDASLIEDNSSPSIDGIKSKMPQHFETVVEWGILRKLHPENGRKMEYAGMYENEIRKKKAADGISKGRGIVGHKDRAILNSRSYLRG